MTLQSWMRLFKTSLHSIRLVQEFMLVCIIGLTEGGRSYHSFASTKRRSSAI